MSSVPEPFLAMRLGLCSCFCLSGDPGVVSDPEARLLVSDLNAFPGYKAYKSDNRDSDDFLQDIDRLRAQPEDVVERAAPPVPIEAQVPTVRQGAAPTPSIVSEAQQLSAQYASRRGADSDPPPTIADTKFSKIQRKPTRQAEEGESLYWLNDVVRTIWPKVGPAVRHVLEKEVLPKIQEQAPKMLQATMKSIHFPKFEFGNKPPELSNIRVFEIQTDSGPCIELEITMALDADIDVEIAMPSAAGDIKLGVTKLVVAGDLALRLEPLIDEAPVVGGLVAFFYDQPRIDISFSGLGGAFSQTPQITNLIRGILDQQIGNLFVLPNVWCQKIGRDDQGVDLAHLHRPTPIGVLTVTALRATGLRAADWNMFGSATSDPYLRIKLSDQVWTSDVVKKNCNPVWKDGNNSNNYLVYSQDQRLKIEVYDQDLGAMIGLGKDDYLGCCKPLNIIEALKLSEQPIQLFDPDDESKTAGEVYLRFDWFELGEIIKNEADITKEDNFVLEVKVDAADLPETLGTQAGLRAKFAGQTQSSKVAEFQEKVIMTAVNAAREKCAKNCHRLNKSLDEIKKVTCIEKDALEFLLGIKVKPDVNVKRKRSSLGESVKWIESAFSKQITPEKAPLENEHVSRHTLELGFILRFIVTGDQLQQGKVELELFNGPIGSLGKADRLKDKFFGVKDKVDFEGEDKVSADITISVRKLFKGRLQKRKGHLSKGRDRPTAIPRSVSEQPMTTQLKAEGRYCEWLNEMLEAMWPNIGKAVHQLVNRDVVRDINKQLPGLNVSFPVCDLGKRCPSIGPIDVAKSEDNKMIDINLGVDFESDIEIRMETRVATIGIKRVRLHGEVCCRMMHFIEQMPILGGMVIYFLDAPTIDYTFTDSVKIANISMLKRKIGDALKAQITQTMVLPNVLSVALGTEDQGVDRASLNRPTPVGVLKVTALRGRDLVAADVNLFSAATSDPYLRITFADQLWTSPVVKATLNPEWNSGVVTRYFLVYNMLQTVTVQVFDHDDLSSDDHIGSVRPFAVEEAPRLSEKELEVLHPKTGEKGAGFVTMKLEMISISPRPLPPTPPTDKSTHHVILEVKVDAVWMSASFGGSCKMSAKFGGRVNVTRVKSVTSPEEAANAVGTELEAIVKRCTAPKLDWKMDELMKITELSEHEISKMLSATSTKLDKTAKQSAKDSTVYLIDLEYILRFVVPTREVLRPGARIDLAIESDGNDVLGTATIQLDDVKWQTTQVISFKNRGNKELKAEITVSTLGLPEKGPDDETDVEKSVIAKSRARMLSCLAGPCSKICGS